jgi:hypothetical protein
VTLPLAKASATSFALRPFLGGLAGSAPGFEVVGFEVVGFAAPGVATADVSARGFPDDVEAAGLEANDDGFDDEVFDDDGFDDEVFDDDGVEDDGVDDDGVDDGFGDVGVDDDGGGRPSAVVSVPDAASVSVALVSPRRGVFIATTPSKKRLARPGPQSPAARLGDSGRAVG